MSGFIVGSGNANSVTEGKIWNTRDFRNCLNMAEDAENGDLDEIPEALFPIVHL